MTDFFFFGCYFCLLITAYLLFFHTSTYQTYSSKILGFVMTVYAISITGYLLIISELMLSVPFLYKTFAPFNLLIPPLGYLYIRAVVQNERKISWNDFFHFIPFLIFVGSYTPFYFMPIQEKWTIVNAVVHNYSNNYKSQDGIIPEGVYYIIRFFQSFLYVYFQWRLIRKAQKQESITFTIPHKSAVIKWLKFFTFMPMVAMLGLVAIFVVVLLSKGDEQSASTSWYSLIVAMSIFSFSVYLLLSPRLLYGIPFFDFKEIDQVVGKGTGHTLADLGTTYANDIYIIETLFIKERLFLTPNLSISLVSVTIGIPARDLSFIINNHYKLRFNDFVNKFRIDYITEQINKGWLRNYTIESLFTSAGFVNKATFNAAFKKHKNDTPSGYIKKFNNVIQ